MLILSNTNPRILRKLGTSLVICHATATWAVAMTPESLVCGGKLEMLTAWTLKFNKQMHDDVYELIFECSSQRHFSH